MSYSRCLALDNIGHFYKNGEQEAISEILPYLESFYYRDEITNGQSFIDDYYSNEQKDHLRNNTNLFFDEYFKYSFDNEETVSEAVDLFDELNVSKENYVLSHNDLNSSNVRSLYSSPLDT